MWVSGVAHSTSEKGWLIQLYIVWEFVVTWIWMAVSWPGYNIQILRYGQTPDVLRFGEGWRLGVSGWAHCVHNGLIANRHGLKSKEKRGDCPLNQGCLFQTWNKSNPKKIFEMQSKLKIIAQLTFRHPTTNQIYSASGQCKIYINFNRSGVRTLIIYFN